ncbi:MAG: HEAT repeat domain-containing protein [Gemmatimonadaceae bacterium]
MSMRILVLAAPLALVTQALGAQLARKVDGANSGNVEFTFAGRPGVCGDGRTFVRVDGDFWMGHFNDNARAECEPGPVRVVIVRVDREPIRVESYVGPVAHDSLSTDVGRVAAGDAASYLMQLATSAEGRVARDALTAASLADSAQITRQLLAIARDQTKSRELRRSALSWAVRPRAGSGLPMDEGLKVLTTIANDVNEQQSMRQQATSQLGRFERGEGIPTLITMAQRDADPWLARQALETLNRSGDPRARRAVRDFVTSAGTPEDIRTAAITALAGEYATAKDGDLIRDAYGRLTGDRARDAAISAVASVGGPASRTWLANLVRNKDQAMRQRRKAAEQIGRGGSSSTEIASLYDAVDDAEIRSVLIDVLAQTGTKDAGAKLLSIAKSDPQVTTRKRAIGALARFEDPTIKNALRDLVERGTP